MHAKLSPHERAQSLTPLFAASAAEHDRDGSVPWQNFERLSQAGLLALTVPAVFGGGGAGLLETSRVVAAIARGEPATALILVMHYLQHRAIAASKTWPRHLAELVARKSVEGVSLINALRVEPELGTPARGGLPATTARRVSEGWRITGHKIYSTGASYLSWYLVWARTDEEPPRVGFFLVPADAPGIRVAASWNHLGLRASGSHDVVLEDVVVPPDHAVDLRAPEAWPPDAFHAAGNAVLISALYDAIARAARDWLVGFLKKRAPTSLGAALATVPRIQEKVGEIEAGLAVNRRLIESLAKEVDKGRLPPAADSSLVKLSVTNNAIKAVETAITLTGNHGLARGNPLERHYRDVLCARVHTPQDDSVLLAAGKLALGV